MEATFRPAERLLSACLEGYAGYRLSARAQFRASGTVRNGKGSHAVINEAASQAETGTDAASPAADRTAAALERLFGRYHFPAGPRRILLAAATAFAERGFHATTTRDIAAQAGLSPAALYVYFRSKEEVLHQITTSALDFTIEVVATEASRPGSPADRLAGLARVLTLWTTYNSQVAHVVLYQTGALSPAHLADITARQREVGQIVRQVIADGINSRDFDIPDPGAAAIAVLSLCLDVARWYRPGHRPTPQQLGDFNAAAALRIAGRRLA
jgi:AcrR family transcriptional regulator